MQHRTSPEGATETIVISEESPRFEKHVPLPTRVARVCAVALPNTLTDAKVRA